MLRLGWTSGGWTTFARIHEENDHSRYGFDSLDNGWALNQDTLINIEGVSFNEMIFIRRDTNEFYYVQLNTERTWPTFNVSPQNGNGYTIDENPNAPGQYIRAYDEDPGKNFQLCFLDAHNDECGPTSNDDINNYGDAGENDDHNMLWAGEEIDAIGTGITWDFAIR